MNTTDAWQQAIHEYPKQDSLDSLRQRIRHPPRLAPPFHATTVCHIPLGSTITSASPAEVNLIEPLLDGAYGRSMIRRLIYDRAADSDPLRQRLAKRRIKLICPHRSNRRKPATQDGRPLDTNVVGRWSVRLPGLATSVV